MIDASSLSPFAALLLAVRPWPRSDVSAQATIACYLLTPEPFRKLAQGEVEVMVGWVEEKAAVYARAALAELLLLGLVEVSAVSLRDPFYRKTPLGERLTPPREVALLRLAREEWS